MSNSEANLYIPFLASDNDLCSVVLQQEMIATIFLKVEQVAVRMVGEGARPQVVLDLEHLQIANYAVFPPLLPEQQEIIRTMHKKYPIRTEDMAYLALRSLFCYCWSRPESADDVRRAAAYEKSLELVLMGMRDEVAKRLEDAEGQLPYWGRLAFLRVMANIPNEQIDAHGLSKIGCVLLKEPAFNARSFQFENHGLIGLNFALEPILKGLNRMLLHYFDTQDMAGPKRMERVLASLIPTVAYFWATAPVRAERLSLCHPLFDKEMAVNAHAMTASQIDFIVRHELGHLVLNHGVRLRGKAGTEEVKALKHEFELAADTFAQGSLRSSLYLRLRAVLQWGGEEKPQQDCNESALAALHEHQREVSSIRLLFMYMEVIDELGKLLKNRLGASILFRTMLDSHPTSRERVSQLDAMHVGEHTPTSKLLRYAEQLFSDVLTYAGNIEAAQLAEHLEDLF